MTAVAPGARRGLALAGIGAGVVILAAILLHLIGHPWICSCGTVKLWGAANTPDNSQHLFDWYSFSHVIHGILFYGALWLVARRVPFATRALVALIIETGWEMLENTPFIINRYREATISLNYFGDSVINSLSDILMMLVGFFLASRLPVWASVVVIVALEALAVYAIRDGLSLNIIMLIHPFEAIKAWQAGV